jgi:hypothetical protein
VQAIWITLATLGQFDDFLCDQLGYRIGAVR